VVVDYAHSPDAIEQALTALRGAVGSTGELICVFGCGGDRDRGRDRKWVASRHGSPIASWLPATTRARKIRRRLPAKSFTVSGTRATVAIRWNSTARRDCYDDCEAKPGDVVLLAGKGHNVSGACGAAAVLDAERGARWRRAGPAMMDTATAARAIAGTLRGENVWFDGVATDSRAIGQGELFVALKGERFDGHDYVELARQRGAVAAVVAADRIGTQTGNLLAVADPLGALGALEARFHGRGMEGLAVRRQRGAAAMARPR
jgi:murE/murF fusion protein